MDVRVSFRASVTINGKDIDEVRQKWESLELFSKEAENNYAEFIEVDRAEDAGTFEEIEL